MRRYGLYLLLSAAFVVCSCTTEEVLFDAEEQLENDMKLVDDYLNANDISATPHSSGFHYIIHEEGNSSPIDNSCRWFFHMTVFHLDSTYAFSTIKEVEVARGFPEPYYDMFELYSCERAFVRPPALGALGNLIGVGAKVDLFVPSGLAWATEGYNRLFYPYTQDLRRQIDIPSNTNVLIRAELIKVE